MNNCVLEHFDKEATGFDETILKIIPYYPQMIEALVFALPFNDAREIRVLDLGCGTGSVSLKVKERYGKAQITCLDFSANMIAEANKRLKNYKDVKFINGDFTTSKFDQKYDAIVSSLALHHLKTNEDKKQFYEKVFNNLNDNGVFYNADVVLGSNNYLQHVNMLKWSEFMQKRVSVEEMHSWVLKYEKEDRPAELMLQTKWLAESGFKDIDVVWKYYNFAVYGGMKHK